LLKIKNPASSAMLRMQEDGVWWRSGLPAVLQLHFFRKRAPLLRHFEQQGLIKRILSLLGHTDALGCIPSVLFSTPHFCPQPSVENGNAGSPFEFPANTLGFGGGTLVPSGTLAPPDQETNLG
jgi:hypothetical protein